jgi:Avidin family
MHLEHVLEQRTGWSAPTREENDPFTGTWTNQLGSVMQLTLDADDTLTGSYTSAVGDTTTYPLTGQADADAVVFTVSFAASGSITAWAGHYDPRTEHLEMLWNLVTQRDSNDALWHATFAGFDIFTQS